MADGLRTRLAHAWNAFVNRNEEYQARPFDMGTAYGDRPDRYRPRFSSDRTIIQAVYARMSVDVAAVDMRHVKLDDKGRYEKDVDSGLHECLNVEANIDQSGRMFMQDIALTLFNEGVIAIVPVDTAISPENSASIDIKTMRVGKIVQWYPQHVRVDLYNERTGRHEQVTLSKRAVAIVENPLYSVMNEPNSTLQRLIRKLHLLDFVDEQSSSGKLDMLIQLPYTIKTDVKRDQAEKRRKDIEFQLKNSQYGIAYIDGTEKVTQLNRPAENNLLKQVEMLTIMLYGQLGITAEVMNGTADEATMLNYNNRVIEPVLSAVADEMKRKFLSKTARTQKQSIMFFRDPFKLVPMAQFAELMDKLTRNEVISSNEGRGFIGLSPSTDPKADELRNSNMPHPKTLPIAEDDGSDALIDDAFSEVNGALDEIFADLEGVA